MGFLFLLLIALIVLLVVFRIAANNAELKSEQIEFDTQKTVQEITDVLRSYRCSMEKLDSDPLAGATGGPEPVIEVLMSGRAGITDAFKHFGTGMSNWGVQVIVYDLGNKRHVVLVAIGLQGLAVPEVARATHNDFYHLTHSKDYRDRIAQSLA